MTKSAVDFEGVFRQLPAPMLLLSPDFDIVDMNLQYLRVAGRTREELLGRNVFDAFPDNPADPSASGVRDLRESLNRVLATGEPDTLPFQQYDVEVPGQPGAFARRFWCPVNAPVFASDGQMVLIIQYVEEITDKVHRLTGGLSIRELREGHSGEISNPDHAGVLAGR